MRKYYYPRQDKKYGNTGDFLPCSTKYIGRSEHFSGTAQLQFNCIWRAGIQHQKGNQKAYDFLPLLFFCQLVGRKNILWGCKNLYDF